MVRMSNQATHLHIDKLNTPLSPLCARDKKRPEYSDLWADGETILMGESPYSDCRQDTARHEMCRGAIACTLTDVRSTSSGLHSPYLPKTNKNGTD